MEGARAMQLFNFDLISDITNPNELIKANFMGGSRTAVYGLFNSEGFPSFRIGRKMYVLKDKLIQWLEQQVGK